MLGMDPSLRESLAAEHLSSGELLCLLDVMQGLASVKSTDEIARIIRSAAWELSRADGVALVLLDGEEVFYADEDAIAPLWKGRRFPLASCVSGLAIRSGEQVCIDNIETDPRIPAESYRETFVRSLLMTPIGRDTPLGAVGTYWASPRSVSARDRRVMAHLASAAEIALRNAELRLQTQEAADRLALALEAGNVGIWDFRPGPEIMVWDAKTASLFDVPHETQVSYESFLSRLHPEDRYGADQTFRAALSGENGGECNLVCRTAWSGSDVERWVHLRGRALFDASGRPDRLLGTVVDNSHERQLQERERRAREQAEAANRAKDEFFAVLGHELRNPLAPIVTALHLMRSRTPSIDRERAVIERQVGHLTRLIDDLLDVSRVTRGKIKLGRQPIDLGSVLETALESTAPLLEGRGHQLVLELPAESISVLGDADRLAQIFSNLLTNAAKYTEPKGTITIRGRLEGDRAVVSVRDNGRGMTSELLARIFEPFAQGPQTMDRSVGGLGIGLTIVDALVRLHGGWITAESDGLGRGSTFSVFLPATHSTEPRPVALPLEPANPRVTRGRRVLVVDDNADIANLMAEVLQEAGCEARVAYDAASALDALDDFEPEIAFLDIGLPVIDGFELARRLRSLPCCERLRLVAVTGYGSPDLRARSVEAGFEAHLTKPVEPDQLLAIIESEATSVSARGASGGLELHDCSVPCP